MKGYFSRTANWFPSTACKLALALSLLGIGVAQAQTGYKVVPANGAMNVSRSAPVVFTFNQPMDPVGTTVTFQGGTTYPFTTYPVSTTWSAGNTVLTCTPTTPFPASTFVMWTLDAPYADGSDTISDSGVFMTSAASGGSTGSGTNKITSFTAGKIVEYNQTGTGAPVLEDNAPYMFGATTSLASNRTALSVSMKLPTGSTETLQENSFRPELYYYYDFNTNLTVFETTYPQGDYSFTVTATASNQTVVVTLPTSMTQPSTPHVSNFTAAQSIDPTKPFTLTWDAFVGGTAADFISVDVEPSAFRTPDVATAGALNGTATSVTIPAGTLQANSNYTASVTFYHALWTTNASYATAAYRATATQLDIKTTGGTSGSAPLPVMGNASWNGGVLSFDVTTTAGQKLTFVSTTNPALPISQWPVIWTTNSPGTSVHFTDPNAGSNKVQFYSVRNGS